MSQSVECRGVTKTFAPRSGNDEAYTAIANIDMEIAAGEFVCLLGPSGCGKSTLLHMIAGFDGPTEGEILVNGRPTTGPGRDRGVVFQRDAAIFPWLTVEQNVEYGPRMRGVGRKERMPLVDKYIELVGLTPHRHKFPREISGGMKQRVQIARVLVNEPEILLMDEPFGALDAHTRSVMQHELLEIWSATGQTALFVTHDVSEAIWLSDRIVTMTPGPAAGIRSVRENPFSRPRDRMNVEFVELYNELAQELEHQSVESVTVP